MATTHCINCGKLVRDESESCPFCSAPLEGEKINERSSRTNRIFIAIIFALLFFMGVFTFLLSPVNGGGFLNTKTIPGIIMMLVGIFGVIMSFIWHRKK
ncbi:MAG: hypothetical protein R3251_03540 [Candidatus Spechtbacterales bacterium]|nr:hypothetical protein [Candidatus Spechtbacterales bacterium]